MKREKIQAGFAITAFLTVAFLPQTAARADDDMDAIKARLAEVERQNQAMKARLTELESSVTEDWMTEARKNDVRKIVKDVLADAGTRAGSTNGFSAGYNNGFYLQSDDRNFKLSVGGIFQARYELAMHHAENSAFASKPLAQGKNENASGFDIRRARLNFSGNAFSPNLFYRLEGDFYGNGTGGFTVTDAFIGYAFNDQFKIRAGAFKAPFTKAELQLEGNLELERSEVNFPFDAQRSLGVSLFGDIIKDKFSYELNANDGSKTNTLRYVDMYSNVTTISSSSTPAYNLDNRLAFYGRLQYAGAGEIREFYDGGEADLRADPSEFVWLLGIAGGYESQNSSAAAFAQNTLTVTGLGSNDSPGFAKAYALNGDIFRGTLDWSAKYQGLSINTAAYFQEINANPYAGTVSSGLPYNVNKAAFFQHGYTAQMGYMVIPRQLEVLGRVGYLLDEGDPNIGAFYTLGAIYYFSGRNAQISIDGTYSPEAAVTDASTLQIANTREIVLRLQFQLKF